MSKRIRIVLYILSVLSIISVIAAGILVKTGQKANATVSEQQKDVTEIQNQDEKENISTNGKNTERGEADSTEKQNTEKGEFDSTEKEDIAREEPDTTESPQKEEVTILFTGDVLFANAFKAGYDAKGIEGVVSAEVLKELNDADILMVNNEFPFSDRGTPMEDKQFTFRCAPSYVTALTELGVDVVSLANNHTLDYGKEAMSDTFQTLDGAGILYGGAGASVERAEELQVIEAGGRKFGFLAVSRVIPVADWKVEQSTPGIFSCYDDTRLVELVAEAKSECDFVAVYPHWGVEYQAYPESYQTSIAEKCIAAGADVVVGSHTHCLQGIEFIDGKPVFYSLGNFIFGRDIDRSAMVKVTVSTEGEVSYKLIPVFAAGGITQFPNEEKAQEIRDYVNRISSGAGILPDGTVAP